MPSRFPPPWTVELLEESYAVKDASGFSITWFHFQVRPPPIGTYQERMTKQQAYAMAVNFAKLPELLAKKPKV